MIRLLVPLFPYCVRTLGACVKEQRQASVLNDSSRGILSRETIQEQYRSTIDDE